MRLSYDVADPSDLGVDAEKLDALIDRAGREIDDGLLPSCQLAVARDGQLVANVTLGLADAATRYVIFSATKSVVAGAVWLLMSQRRLDVGQKVSEIFPEFASNGKDAITVEQVLTHTSGFPGAPLPLPAWLDRDLRLERMSRWRLNWEPGSQFEYHPTSAHWVLAEVIERISGMDYRQFVHEHLLEPLGLAGPRLGVPEEDQAGIAQLVGVGQPPTSEELEEALGVPVLGVVRSPMRRCSASTAPRRGPPGYLGRVVSLVPRTLPSGTRPCSTIPATCGTRACWPTPPARSAAGSPTR